MQELIDRFQTREAHVAVIGLGYVGLPLALTFAKAGYQVTGIDVDARKVDAINRGESYIGDVDSSEVAEFATTTPVPISPAPATVAVSPAAINTSLQSASPSTLSGTSVCHNRLFCVASCDAVSICVPTPLNKTGDPDMSYILSATEQVAKYLHTGMVIVLESTTYPGTTTEILLPILRDSLASSEQQPGTQWTIGQDFYLAFSPERVDPGRQDWTTHNTPKVIGGITPDCLTVACAFYGQAIETLVPVSSPEAAEMVKLFENTFRSVNIGLANELLLMCDKLDLDAWEILEAAATKPFGFMKFTPGPGLGGHCIPIDPHYLSWKMRSLEYNARFIELASEINTEMPRYWVQKVQDALNDAGKPVKGSRILVLGVAYKKDVNDLRESPALDIIHLLETKGAQVNYHDPHVPNFHHDGMEMVGVPDLVSALNTADCVIIITDHSDYDWQQIRSNARLIVDTRHILN